MTEQEWIDLAKHYDEMAERAFDADDVSAGELWTRKAESCRYASCYGTVEEGTEQP